MAWSRGAVVGERYRLDHKVGAGGMGEVWAAEHVGVGTRVALKTLLKDRAKDREMVTRLKREAYYLGRIQSDHVARVLDFIDDPRWGLVLVMEFVEGDKLSTVLTDKKRLSVEETIDIGADLASALCDLHRANVIHRDLKPANVILKPVPGGGKRAMIVDFGLSRLLLDDAGMDASEEAITGITGVNMALGTVEYMAPEQVLNSRDVTQASDLYALGALLHRAVAGSHVFGGLSEGYLAHAKITRDPPALDTGRGDRIASGLESVVAHALARRPADRYDRADLMLAELSSLRDLARLSALDVGADTEDGMSESRLFELRTTARLPVSQAEAARVAQLAAGAEADGPTSTEAITMRLQVGGPMRQSTLRMPLSAAASMGGERSEASGSSAYMRDEAATTAVSARVVVPPVGRVTAPFVRKAQAQLAPVAVDDAPASREGPRSEVAPTRGGVSPFYAVAASLVALGIGFATGRLTSPGMRVAAEPAPATPEVPVATATSTAATPTATATATVTATETGAAAGASVGTAAGAGTGTGTGTAMNRPPSAVGAGVGVARPAPARPTAVVPGPAPGVPSAPAVTPRPDDPYQ